MTNFSDGDMPTSAHPRGLGRLGYRGAQHPRLTIALWVALVVVAVVAAKLAAGTFNDKVSLTGTQANTGLNLLSDSEKSAGGYVGEVVFHVSTGTLKDKSSAIEESVTNLAGLAHVQAASDPLATGSPSLSANGRIGYSNVHFDEQPKLLGSAYKTKLADATHPATSDGVEVEFGGSLDTLYRPPANDALSEVIGFAVALLVLLIGFGSVAGAIVPLVSALIAVAVGVGILEIASSFMTFGTTAPTLALMIGLGVGIDYALFLTTRQRQQVADGVCPASAAGWTVGTSGHAVLVAAGTVSLALLGLYASGITFIGQLGLAAVFSVVTAATAALTFVPGLFGALGTRIDKLAVKTPVAESGSTGDGWHRYARFVATHPWKLLVVALVLLGILTVPLLSIDLGHIDDGGDPTSFTDKRAYDLISQGFGIGANGPFTIVVDVRHATKSATSIANKLEDALTKTPGVAHASMPEPSSNGAILAGTVVPSTSPQSSASSDLFSRLVNTTIPDSLRGTGARGYVAGNLATQLQFRDTLSSRLPIVIGVVVALAFLLLMTTFRSLLIAIKAAVLNLLSIGAAYGVVVAVFQWGWGSSLFGVGEKVPIESYVPVLMFAIVFGLSMDYEVFLLSRIKEAWERTNDNTAAVADGLSRTARVITCAGLIMASVFISFTLSSAVVVKMLAVGLSVSVLIDASIVRLVLVPATMTLFGTANWWLPEWLDRILPHIDAEGPTRAPVPQPVASSLEGAAS